MSVKLWNKRSGDVITVKVDAADRFDALSAVKSQYAEYEIIEFID